MLRSLLLLLAFGPVAAPLTESEIARVLKSFDQRRDAVLVRHIEDTFPDPNCPAVPPTGNRCVQGKLNFALAAFMNRNAAERERANAAVIEACARIPNDPGYKSYSNPRDRTSPRVDGAYDFHFVTGPLLARIFEMFRGRGLSRPAEDAVRAMFWDYAGTDCRLRNADPKRTWYIWGSENHSAMRDSTCWAAAKMLQDAPAYAARKYEDGSTAAQQYSGWTAFLKEYIRERGRKGMLVEIFAFGYAGHTLQNFYNYFDFTDDQELRRLSRSFLDLWWADWAQEQIQGVHGGSKARCYPKSAVAGTPMSGVEWLYLNMGQARPERVQSPAYAGVLTSSYRLPPVVVDLALDLDGRGAYAAESRRPGLNLLPPPEDIDRDGYHKSGYALDPAFGGIYRYTWVTPEFVMGASMLDKRRHEEWSSISDQNRWHGLILKGDPEHRIYPYTADADRDRAYNAFWAVQNQGTQVTLKLPQPYSRQFNEMRVWFGKGLPRTEKDGWVFIDAAAFVAVRPAWGGHAWDSAEARSMIVKDQKAPVIIEAARRSEFKDFAAFQNAVLKKPIEVRNGVLDYRGLRLHLDANRLPEIDGRPVDLKPSFTFRSPFLQQDWATGRVTIRKGGRELPLNFN